MQIEDGNRGFLIEPQHYDDDDAERVLKILCDPDLGAELGSKGKKHIRENFLMPRLLLNWLELLSEMM